MQGRLHGSLIEAAGRYRHLPFGAQKELEYVELRRGQTLAAQFGLQSIADREISAFQGKESRRRAHQLTMTASRRKAQRFLVDVNFGGRCSTDRVEPNDMVLATEQTLGRQFRLR